MKREQREEDISGAQSAHSTTIKEQHRDEMEKKYTRAGNVKEREDVPTRDKLVGVGPYSKGCQPSVDL